MKISFLLQNAFGIGGTIRSTFSLAGALAARAGNEVEIVSVLRTQDQPRLPLSREVRLHSLIDRRETAIVSPEETELAAAPSELVPDCEAADAQFSGLTDRRVAGHLARTDADVVIATRPGLVLYLAEYGRDSRRGYLRLGQEHRIYETHGTGTMRTALNAAIARLDAYVTASDADAAVHRHHLPYLTTRLLGIPGGVPVPRVEPSDGTTQLIIAAGRLVPVKRYELLIEAFAKVAAERPDWRLRIYGRGSERPRLRAAIDGFGLSDHVSLMGPRSPIETEWAKGSIAALTSDEEAFGMTIVEAMHCGLPVVATDCPHGPREIITDGEDGLLVPAGDADAIATALLKLINDDELRASMGEYAQLTARRYAPNRIAGEYQRLIEELRQSRETALTELTVRLRRRAGRLVRPLRRTAHTAAPPPAETAAAPCEDPPQQPGRPGPLRPRAACRVDGRGNLVVRLNPAGLSGTGLSLVLTHRGTPDKRVRVPVHPPETDQAPWTALFQRRDLALAEGRWDLHVEREEDHARRRVTSELVEQRGLLSLRPLLGQPLSWYIPYRTSDGCIALRAWYRAFHAEADALRVSDDTLTVHGTLHGTEFISSASPAVLGAARAGDTSSFTAEVEPLDRTHFRLTIPYSQPLAARGAERDVWDLSLLLAPGAEPIRIGRLIGDLVERKKIDSHPTAVLESPGRGPTRLRPFFTVTNDLAISAADLAEPE